MESNLPLTAEEFKRLESMTMIGRPVKFKNKGSAGHWVVGIVVDEVYYIIGDYKHLIQKVKFADNVSWDTSEHGYRTGYYTYQHGKKYIKWGQYTQFLTGHEYKRLLEKARLKGWDIF
jgi:hypothetical protein